MRFVADVNKSGSGRCRWFRMLFTRIEKLAVDYWFVYWDCTKCTPVCTPAVSTTFTVPLWHPLIVVPLYCHCIIAISAGIQVNISTKMWYHEIITYLNNLGLMFDTKKEDIAHLCIDQRRLPAMLQSRHRGRHWLQSPAAFCEHAIVLSRVAIIGWSNPVLADYHFMICQQQKEAYHHDWRVIQWKTQ